MRRGSVWRCCWNEGVSVGVEKLEASEEDFHYGVNTCGCRLAIFSTDSYDSNYTALKDFNSFSHEKSAVSYQ